MLHSRPWRETSLLLEVITANHGRLGLVARGARRGKGQAGVLQAFHFLQLRWSPRGELHTLIGAEEIEPLRLPASILPAALYLNELLLNLLARHDECGPVYSIYHHALRRLQAAAALEPVLRDFELDLLDALGFGLTLDKECLDGAAVDPGLWYLYQPRQGLIKIPETVENAMLGHICLAIAARDWSDSATRRAAKRLLRRVLDVHLGQRALRTRELLRGLARMQQRKDRASVEDHGSEASSPQ